MTLIYKLDLDIMKVYTHLPKTNFLDQAFQKLEHKRDRQTDTRDWMHYQLISRVINREERVSFTYTFVFSKKVIMNTYTVQNIIHTSYLFSCIIGESVTTGRKLFELRGDEDGMQIESFAQN